MIRFSSLIVILFTSAISVFGQVPNSVRQSTEWSTLNFSAGVRKKINLLSEINSRFVGNLQPMQHEMILGAEYAFNSKFSVIPAGYAVVWNYRYGEQPAGFANNEHRFWQRIQYKERFGRVLLGQRLALEERSIQMHHADAGATIDDGYKNNQMRLRYRINAVMPLGEEGRVAKYVYLNTWDELCYSWGKAVMHHTPNQNRFFAGVGYQFSQSASLQTGLICQWLKKDNGIQTENNIGFMIQFNYAFALYK